MFSQFLTIMRKEEEREVGMLNKVILIGNLVADPTLKFFPSGTPLCEFTVAWNRKYRHGDEWREERHFFDIKTFGQFAEDLAQRLSKGYQVVIEGRLSQDRWTGRDGKNYSRVRIIAETVKIIRKPRIDEVEEEFIPSGKIEEPDSLDREPFDPFDEDDEIPF